MVISQIAPSPTIVHSDNVVAVQPGTTPDYNENNPLVKLMHIIEGTRFAAEREAYLMDYTQYLAPIGHLDLYGPSGADAGILDPTQQDNKTDFQKQNVKDFLTTDASLVRGWVATDNWTGPFLRLAYRGGPDSKLSQATQHHLGDRIQVWLKVNGVASSSLITLPYNQGTNRYEVEIWGYPGSADELRGHIGEQARGALDRGELQVRNDLIHGSFDDFKRDGLDGRFLFEVAPGNSMHPILPLHIELAWTDQDAHNWDAQNGANYHYEFNMIQRGWENYLGVGISPNPHGGIGYLEYRNLASTYGRYANTQDLTRYLQPWNFDAFGSKQHTHEVENFLAVDYMDLHLLKPFCGIGLHRHRDNQEVFLMMQGRGFMVVGDWCKMPERERCFEVRTLREGHLAMLKGGNLHALINPGDQNLSLFMFGGYD